MRHAKPLLVDSGSKRQRLLLREPWYSRWYRNGADERGHFEYQQPPSQRKSERNDFLGRRVFLVS